MTDMTHIDWCIALEPEACEGTCYDERIEEVEEELETVRDMLNGPQWDLTIETETRLQHSEERLEDELYRLKI